jgi:hypothetical protein
LVRAAAYREASSRERLEVHAALAQVTDPILDPDRRAWHRANSTIAQDDEIALELERAAARAKDVTGIRHRGQPRLQGDNDTVGAHILVPTPCTSSVDRFAMQWPANVPGTITSSRSSSGPVAQGDRTRSELMAMHELELDPLSQTGEQRRPMAGQNRLHDELVLVD